MGADRVCGSYAYVQMYHGTDPLQLARVSLPSIPSSNPRLPPCTLFSWFSMGNLFFAAVLYRSKPTSPKSIRDQRQSTSLAACSSISRRACATGYAPALWVHCSSRTRSLLVMAERATTGPKAVRRFTFSFLFCAHRHAGRPRGQSIPMVC